MSATHPEVPASTDAGSGAVDYARTRKPYLKPTLIRYGSVSLLTGSSNGSGTDGGSMSTMTLQSDLACKQSIERIGTHPLGFGLYLFDYKPGFGTPARLGRRQFGVIAQEVEPIVPEAVTLAANGYRQVDYARLGITLARH